MYKNERFRNLANNKIVFNKKYGNNSYDKFKKAIEYLHAIDNLGEARKYPGLRLEKMNGKSNIGKFRLNKSLRVEFKYDENKEFLKIQEIEIIKIHNHKYIKT